MKLKLDLHTHCYEASGFCDPTLDSVEEIVANITAHGLDGIAITDHYNKSFGYKVKDIVERFFNSTVLIIPGQEVEEWPVEIVELYLPCNATFRFVAHPGYPGDFVKNAHGVHGIEIENGGHNWHMDKRAIKKVATSCGLLLLSNSDAHYLEDIGRFYNEITLKELYKRANAK